MGPGKGMLLKVVVVLVLASAGAAGALEEGLGPDPDTVEGAKAAAWGGVRTATANSLLTSAAAALITYSLAIGTAFSVLYFGTWTKRVLNELLRTLACLSPLVMLLLVYAARDRLGPWFLLFLAVSIYPLIGRQLLARVAEEAEEYQFMQAKILGHGPLGVFFYYALPKFVPLTLPYFFVGFIYSLLLESMFSSLGLLALPGGETWGSLIYRGTSDLLDDPWLVFYSGYAIIATTLAASICVPVVDRFLSLPKAESHGT